MRWRAIQYGWPEAVLFLFAVLILLMAFITLYRYRQNKLTALADQRVLAYIQEPRLSILYWIKSFFFCIAWIFAVFALMEPKGNGRYPISPLEQYEKKSSKPNIMRQVAQDVIFLIDASASMGVTDSPTGKSRLSEAKEVAEEVVSRLRGQNAALFAFTSTTLQLVPLTTDYLFARLMLRQLAINEGETAGTEILQALTSMRNQFFNSASQKQTFLILLSDGEDTHLESLQGSEREEYIQKINRIIHNANAKQLHVYVVGLGSKQGKEVPGVTFQGHPVISALNEDLLRQIARTAEGELLLSRERTTLQTADAILEGLKANQQFQDKIITSPRIEGDQDELVYDLYFQIPLSIGIIALTLALLLPETRRYVTKRIAHDE